MGLKFSEVVTLLFLTTGVDRAMGNIIVRLVEIQRSGWDYRSSTEATTEVLLIHRSKRTYAKL